MTKKLYSTIKGFEFVSYWMLFLFLAPITIMITITEWDDTKKEVHFLNQFYVECIDVIGLFVQKCMRKIINFEFFAFIFSY